MLTSDKLIFLFYSFGFILSLTKSENIDEHHEGYTNEWVVKVHNENELHKIISDGFLLKEKVKQEI